jgi:hypothetical protein
MKKKYLNNYEFQSKHLEREKKVKRWRKKLTYPKNSFCEQC